MRYRHKKTGKVYNFVGVAKHSETLEEGTVYYGTGEGGSTGLWFRPKHMFNDGRFEKIKDDPQPQVYQVWCEGWACYPGDGVNPAMLIGTAVADCFASAVRHFDALGKFEYSGDPSILLQNDDESFVFWGCQLFDNEEEARKSFG